jgi:hypothetical protein
VATIVQDLVQQIVLANLGALFDCRDLDLLAGFPRAQQLHRKLIHLYRHQVVVFETSGLDDIGMFTNHCFLLAISE